MVLHESKLIGVVIYGDLRRTIDANINVEEVIVGEVMNVSSSCIKPDVLAMDAVRVMEQKMISRLSSTNLI